MCFLPFFRIKISFHLVVNTLFSVVKSSLYCRLAQDKPTSWGVFSLCHLRPWMSRPFCVGKHKIFSFSFSENTTNMICANMSGGHTHTCAEPQDTSSTELENPMPGLTTTEPTSTWCPTQTGLIPQVAGPTAPTPVSTTTIPVCAQQQSCKIPSLAARPLCSI